MGRFSRRRIDEIFLFFPREKNLIIHAICLLRRQFAINVKFCLLGKIRKFFKISSAVKLPGLLNVKLFTIIYSNIQDGKDNKLQRWTPQRTNGGVFTGSIMISEEPVFGNWKIVASAMVSFSLRKHAYSKILKILQPKKDIFHIPAQNIDCGYSLEPPRRGGSNEYPQSMFF